MKPFFSLSLITSAALLAAGCSGGSDEPTPTPSEPKKVEIKISPSVSESRATDYGFEKGDRVGLYVVNRTDGVSGSLLDAGNYVDNMRFTYDGTWVPDTPIFWKDKDTHADFYLYYPYSTVSSVKALSFALQPDQSSEAAYKSSDFMVGKKTNVAPTAEATVINVSHIMSRINITLEAGNGFTKESLVASNVSVRINGVKCNSTIDLSTGTVIATGSATNVTPFFADNTYKALIVPQTVAEGNLITVTVDGREFNLKKGFTFVSSKSHKFTVTLSKTSNGVNVNINPWTDDGTDNGGTAE